MNSQHFFWKNFFLAFFYFFSVDHHHFCKQIQGFHYQQLLSFWHCLFPFSKWVHLLGNSILHILGKRNLFLVKCKIYIFCSNEHCSKIVFHDLSECRDPFSLSWQVFSTSPCFSLSNLHPRKDFNQEHNWFPSISNFLPYISY